MTSNRPIQDWGKLLGDVPAASAILDRFLTTPKPSLSPAASYRLKDQTSAKEKNHPTKLPENPHMIEPLEGTVAL